MNLTNTKLKAYVGTYTNGKSEGIYSFVLDTTSGSLEDVKLAAKLDNPTYLSITNNNKYLYSVIKTGNSGGTAAFSINNTSELELINYEVEEGSPPCHISLDSHNKYVFSANYHKGNVSVFPAREDGGLSKASSLVSHEGSGPNLKRQEKPHAHYSALTPEDKYLCVVDLGIDKLMTYTFNNGTLSKHKELLLKPACGPRHMVFHPNGRFAYILTELSAEVVALDYNDADGSFNIIQYISSLPANYSEENLGSAVHISPDGKFLYASNRGHNSIAVFSIDKSCGKLTLIAHTSTEGASPRDFTIAPGGDFLIAANQDSSNIVAFTIDKTTGRLSRVGDIITIPNPVCIKFIQ
jgi:6-phosphogluconolactonase